MSEDKITGAELDAIFGEGARLPAEAMQLLFSNADGWTIDEVRTQLRVIARVTARERQELVGEAHFDREDVREAIRIEAGGCDHPISTGIKVPAIPTEAMLQAGCDAIWPGGECYYDQIHEGPEFAVLAAWKAMISEALA